MKARSSLISVLLLYLGIAAAQDKVLAIIDQSASGSPLENTGNVTLSETAMGEGRASVSHSDDWTVKNLSQKPIVAIVETLVVRDEVRETVRRTAQYDAFFQPDLVEPGHVISFSEPSTDNKHLLSKSSAYVPADSPVCEVTVRWVQFADGSTFGDSSYAKGILEFRAATMKVLQHLKEVYINEGQEKFSEQLQDQVNPPEADGFLQHIRNLQRKHGTQKAAETLEMHLNTGEQRAAKLNEAVP
jgi:hypothetical protein